MEDTKKICCICGKEFTEWGNDPWPVNMLEKATCCDFCDWMVVVPARLKMMREAKK